MTGLSTLALVSLFAAAAAATWFAGVYLSRATDSLDFRLKLGEAFGGMVLLAIAGSLPEVAVTLSAAATKHLDVAAGNLIGGIAVQTMVLVIIDFAIVGDRPLSYLVGSLEPVLEAILVVMVVAVVMMGALLPPSVSWGGVSPASLLIVAVWLAGLLVLNVVRKNPAWKTSAPGSRPGRPHRRVPHPTVVHPYAAWPTWRVVLVFVAGSLVTLGAGVALTLAGVTLADRAGINGVVFGATVLALMTALPEISTGIAAIRLGDHRLVMGDIYGGNAFQVCLFLIADLVAGRPVLPAAGTANSWLAALGIVLTVVYAGSIIVRPRRLFLRLGPDSWTAIAVFLIGMLGLLRLAR
jgi:cation:H+ antiporter